MLVFPSMSSANRIHSTCAIMHSSLDRRDGVAPYRNSSTSRTVFGAAPRHSDLLAQPCVGKQFASFVLKGDTLGRRLISFGFYPILTFREILAAMAKATTQLFYQGCPAALPFPPELCDRRFDSSRTLNRSLFDSSKQRVSTQSIAYLTCLQISRHFDG